MRPRAKLRFALSALTCTLLVMVETSLADSKVTRITHVEDASSDRTPLVTAVPKYPEAARRDRIEGEATVCYTIDVRGKIRRPTVKKSSHRMFAKPALRAIKQSSYEPLQGDDKASVARACRTYRFLLNPVAIEEID